MQGKVRIIALTFVICSGLIARPAGIDSLKCIFSVRPLFQAPGAGGILVSDILYIFHIPQLRVYPLAPQRLKRAGSLRQIEIDLFILRTGE